MTSPEITNRNDPLNNYAQRIIQVHHNEINQKYGIILQQLETQIRRAGDQPRLVIPDNAPKVGIIGGGIGGLYAAMLLQERRIPYEILEASPRIGGRLYTQRMGELPNDYYDAGAMRFPDTPVMRPVFDLFNRIGVELGEFLFADKYNNSTLLYNEINKRRTAVPVTPQDFKVTGIPDHWGDLGWKANVENVVHPFAERLIKDFFEGTDEGWKTMMRYDKYSTRAYMSADRKDNDPELELDKAQLMPYPVEVVNWCETFDASSGSYNKGLSEKVLDSLAFSWDGNPIRWYYVLGGSEQIVHKLNNYMSRRPEYTPPLLNTRVTGITAVFANASQVPPPHVAPRAQASSQLAPGETLPPTGYVLVQLANGQRKQYSHVITTTTLPCLRTMNLKHALLDWPQKQAIRALQYGPSTKIGVRFKRRWWEDDEWMKARGGYGAIVGGQSYTDNMSRTVVYPSYGVGQPDRGATMIVSYAWTNDALALTALMGPESREVLKQRVLQDLAQIHRFNRSDAVAQLEALWEDMHAFSWTTNPYTMGAFAHFGPGDFSKLYPAMTRPAAGGRLHFAGEVCSVRHAWVLGALEASSRAVDAIIRSSYDAPTLLAHEKEFGVPEGWTAEQLDMQTRIAMTGVIGELPPGGSEVTV